MALSIIFNPFTGKFDYVDIADTSSFQTATPRSVVNGITFNVSTNTQVVHSNPIVTEAGGIVLTTGTASLTYVN